MHKKWINPTLLTGFKVQKAADHSAIYRKDKTVAAESEKRKKPPVKEPPNQPRKPPVKEPETPPDPRPPPAEPPVEEPPNEPRKPPVKEPPKDPGKKRRKLVGGYRLDRG